jgi:hypothetical protein
LLQLPPFIRCCASMSMYRVCGSGPEAPYSALHDAQRWLEKSTAGCLAMRSAAI